MSRPNAARIRDAALAAWVCVLMAGGTVWLGGDAQAVTPYPPSAPICSVSPDQPNANSTVSVSCTGFDPGTIVMVTGGGSGVTATSSAIIGSSGGTTVNEATGEPGNASWSMVGRLPGGAAGKGVARAAVNGRRGTQAHVRSQVGTVSKNPVRIGQKFTFSGCGYQPGTTETTTDTAGDRFGTSTVGPDGCFHMSMSITSAGNFTLVGRGQAAGGGTLQTTANVTVEALVLNAAGGRGADAGPGLSLAYTDGLAFTGTDGIGLLVMVGCGLTAAGTGLVARSRRRQRVRTI